VLSGSDKRQERVLALVGTAVVFVIVLAALLIVSNPFRGQPRDRISVAIDTPYVGQGVDAGTAVVMHGVKVGEVTNVKFVRGGVVQVRMSLEKRPIAGLTDSMNIDFRPINYFGVSGVNVIPKLGGRSLRDGTNIELVPVGNFTLPTLLSRLGDVSVGALTPRLISVIDRVTRYTDGFNPLFETMVVATTAVADVQRVSSARLLANSSSVSGALPGAFGRGIETAVRFLSLNAYTVPPGVNVATSGPRSKFPYLDRVLVQEFWDMPADFVEDVFKPIMDTAQHGLFASVGKVLGSHSDDLFPLVDSIRSISDATVPLIRSDKFAQTVEELRSRFEKLYAGNSEERALRVRIVLDKLPGVAAPLGVLSAPANTARDAVDGVENRAAAPPEGEDGPR
jgi:hypothetical protein